MNNPLILKIFELDLWEKEIELKKGDFLKRENTIDTNTYFIVEGSIKIYFRDGEHEPIIRLGYSNNLVTALDCFIKEQASPLIFEAIKHTNVKVLRKSTLQEFIASEPIFQESWTEILQQLLVDQMEREIDILTHSPKERYERD